MSKNYPIFPLNSVIPDIRSIKSPAHPSSRFRVVPYNLYVHLQKPPFCKSAQQLKNSQARREEAINIKSA